MRRTSGDLAYEPPANEDPDTQRGYFTKALLEGLSGAAADPPGYGAVDTNSLARYVKQRVKDLTRKFKRPQDPRMDADPAEPIVFRPAAAPPAADVPTGGLPAPTSYQVRIEFVTPYRGHVALRNSANDILREHRTTDGDLIVPLPSGLYQVTQEEPGSPAFPGDGGFRVHGANTHVRI